MEWFEDCRRVDGWFILIPISMDRDPSNWFRRYLRDVHPTIPINIRGWASDKRRPRAPRTGMEHCMATRTVSTATQTLLRNRAHHSGGLPSTPVAATMPSTPESTPMLLSYDWTKRWNLAPPNRLVSFIPPTRQRLWPNTTTTCSNGIYSDGCFQRKRIVRTTEICLQKESVRCRTNWIHFGTEWFKITLEKWN